jgi:hypothetical protein
MLPQIVENRKSMEALSSFRKVADAADNYSARATERSTARKHGCPAASV